ncbi:hypothetical protein WH47_08089, partial [Habropoda laboriosa]
SSRSQMTAMNGKRPSSIPSRHQSETVAQHFDLIKYIYDYFEPFNLEAWWGQRVVQSITRNTNS